MIIKDVLAQLDHASHPVMKRLHGNDSFNVSILGFNKGMILKEHKANKPTKLTVVNGGVLYKEEGRTVTLMRYDELEIPIGIIHSVEALEDSICIFTQG